MIRVWSNSSGKKDRFFCYLELTRLNPGKKNNYFLNPSKKPLPRLAGVLQVSWD